jgi:hypothetical protein
MVEPKMSLIMILPGRIMVSQQVAENKPKEATELNTLKFKSFNKKAKKFVNEVITFRTRKSIPARQVLQMSKEAYKAMLEEPTSPKYSKVVAKVKGKLIRVWDTMSEDARIRKHCELIAHDIGAIDFDYTVFDD